MQSIPAIREGEINVWEDAHQMQSARSPDRTIAERQDRQTMIFSFDDDDEDDVDGDEMTTTTTTTNGRQCRRKSL